MIHVYDRSLRCVLVFALSGGGALLGQDFVVPISANSPQVIVSLTDERNVDDFTFTASSSHYNVTDDRDKTTPIRVLPTNGPPHYDVFIFDTGSPAHIMSYRTTAEFDVALAGLRGTNFTAIGGAGGEFLEASNSDPLAIYAAGFSAITSTEPLNVDTRQFRGQYNVSVLNGEFNTEDPELDLPNLIGTPIASQYTTRILNSEPHIVEIAGTVRRTPDLQLLELGSLDRPLRRLGMRFETAEGAFPTPAFIPDLSSPDINNFSDNPSIPTNTGWFFVDADVENNGVRRSQLEMLFDTGAQGTIVSEQVAVTLGFDVELDDPDFVVRIQGVTGTSEEVPGFLAEEFTLPGTAGGLTLKNVPLIVFNLTDPRDGFSTLPGLLGMNVFANRDVTINPEPGNAYLGLSDPIIATHRWAATQATAAWDAPDHWDAPGTPQLDWYAYVQNTTGSPQTAVIGQDSSVAALVTRGHESSPAGTMRLTIQQDATLTLFGSAIIEDGSTVHLENARLAPLAVEIRGGAISGSGTVEGEVLSQGTLQPGGVGSTGRLDFAGSLDQLSKGRLELDLGNATADDFDRIAVVGALTLNGQLALAPTDDYVSPAAGKSQEFVVVESEGELIGQFASYSFRGTEIGVDCTLDLEDDCTSARADPREFRQDVGGGKFISIFYDNHAVTIEDYQAMPGDTNGDGAVNFNDFLALSSGFGNAGNWRNGDFSGNGRVEFDDFLGLSGNFGIVAAARVASLAAVPEPRAWLLGLPLVTTLLARRRRR